MHDVLRADRREPQHFVHDHLWRRHERNVEKLLSEDRRRHRGRNRRRAADEATPRQAGLRVEPRPSRRASTLLHLETARTARRVVCVCCSPRPQRTRLRSDCPRHVLRSDSSCRLRPGRSSGAHRKPWVECRQEPRPPPARRPSPPDSAAGIRGRIRAGPPAKPRSGATCRPRVRERRRDRSSWRSGHCRSGFQSAKRYSCTTMRVPGFNSFRSLGSRRLTSGVSKAWSRRSHRAGRLSAHR